MARNIETREGYEFWDRLCRLQRYSFFLGDGPSVRRVEDGTGNWIEIYGAQSVMDDAQSEINELREQNAKLEAEAQALRDQVKALQSDANSYQSGYDEGRRMGTKHRQDEVEQLTREVAALRAMLGEGKDP